MRPLQRVDPKLPVAAMQTYQLAAPPDIEVVAACETVGCGAFRHGWDTLVDEATDLGRRQAAFIRQRSGRTFTELRTGSGLTVFRFDAGQRCFADHKTRPVRYLRRGGDWRGHQGLYREHTRPADWVEDFADHQQQLADRLERG
jgi:hypothetical protein